MESIREDDLNDLPLGEVIGGEATELISEGMRATDSRAPEDVEHTEALEHGADGETVSKGQEDPEQSAEPFQIQVVLSICAFDTLLDLLNTVDMAFLRRVAENMPRRIPPKKTGNRRVLQAVIASHWLYAECREFLIDVLDRSGKQLYDAAVTEDGPEKLRGEGFSHNIIAWAHHAMGRNAEEYILSLPFREQREFLRRQDELLDYLASLEKERRDRVEAGEAVQRVQVVKETERRTRNLSWQLDEAKEKQDRATKALEDLVLRHKQEVEGLRRELGEAREHIATLEQTNAALLDENISLHKRLGASTEEPAVQVPREKQPSFDGRRVLVVGDVNRQPAYREIVESLGGEFMFMSGFSTPQAVGTKASGADVVVLVLAGMSHKVFTVATDAGKPVVRVQVAGERAMREALLGHLAKAEREGRAS